MIPSQDGARSTPVNEVRRSMSGSALSRWPPISLTSVQPEASPVQARRGFFVWGSECVPPYSRACTISCRRGSSSARNRSSTSRRSRPMTSPVTEMWLRRDPGGLRRLPLTGAAPARKRFSWWVRMYYNCHAGRGAPLPNPGNDCWLSLADAAGEMAIKVSLGKLRLPSPLERFVPERLGAWVTFRRRQRPAFVIEGYVALGPL